MNTEQIFSEQGKWVAFDLDGTLAEYHGWKGINHIGRPIQAMCQVLAEHKRNGDKIAIFTARLAYDAKSPNGSIDEAYAAIKEWLECWGIPYDDITAVKKKHFVKFYDDRAVQVEPNTGRLILDLSIEQIDEALAMVKTYSEVTEHDTVPNLLRESAATFEERGRQYGYIYKTMHPDVFQALFPNGMELKERDDFTRFALMNAIVGKLTRYANNFSKGGHRDSLIDLVNFAAMLNGVDDEISKR